MVDPVFDHENLIKVAGEPSTDPVEASTIDSRTSVFDENKNENQQSTTEDHSAVTDEEAMDEFFRIHAAHEVLTDAKIFDEGKDYASALHLYRMCVDLLLEELMFTEGTEQSRAYLREKCTAILDRIDQLKALLPSASTTRTINEDNNLSC